ncbi:MAG: helix-turn-helix domain-containing protein, partial [Acidimicrobiales bacterium]
MSEIQVLDRVMAVLVALEDGPLSLAGLISATALPRATAYRLATVRS